MTELELIDYVQERGIVKIINRYVNHFNNVDLKTQLATMINYYKTKKGGFFKEVGLFIFPKLIYSSYSIKNYIDERNSDVFRTRNIELIDIIDLIQDLNIRVDIIPLVENNQKPIYDVDCDSSFITHTSYIKYSRNLIHHCVCRRVCSVVGFGRGVTMIFIILKDTDREHLQSFRDSCGGVKRRNIHLLPQNM